MFGWDTHQNNFDIVQRHSAELDAGWSALIDDMRASGDGIISPEEANAAKEQQ